MISIRTAYRISVRKAEKAVGRLFKGEECVHHVDEDPWNSEGTNLVVCPNHAYHKLLHARQRAYDATGDANKRRCDLCGQCDDVANMTEGKRSGRKNGHNYRHKECGRIQSQIQRDKYK